VFWHLERQVEVGEWHCFHQWNQQICMQWQQQLTPHLFDAATDSADESAVQGQEKMTHGN